MKKSFTLVAVLVVTSCCAFAQTSISGAWSYSGNLTFTGAAAPPVLNPDNLYCPLLGTPTWGASDGPATLPLVCYNTLMANTPAPGAVVNVTANSATDLQAKLTAAVCGQQITLPAGSVYSGHFTLPLLHCTAGNYIWIVTAGLASLPTEGAAYTTTYNGITLYLPQFGPCYAGVASQVGRPALNCPGTPGTYTAKIVTPDSAPPFNFTGGTSSVRLIGLELTRTAGTGFVSELSNLGSIANVDHLIFDRVWCHGDENQDETEACFYTSAASYVASIDSYYNNFYCISSIGTCSDSKAIGGGTNSLNSTTETALKLVNNFLEAAGENIIYGGGTSNTVPADSEMRLNTFFKPLTWNPVSGSYNGGVGAHPFIVKNLFELKNGQRVLLEGNSFINSWCCGQVGEAITLTPKNSFGNCPVCAVTNFTSRYNFISDVAVTYQIANVLDATGHAAFAGNAYSLHDEIFDDVADPLSCGTSSNCAGNPVPLIEIEGTVPGAPTSFNMANITMNHETMVLNASPTAPPSSGFLVDGPNGPVQANFILINSILSAGTFGVAGNFSGVGTHCAYNQSINNLTAWLNLCWTNWTLTNNAIVGGTHSGWNWPSNGGVSFPASYSAVQFTNYNGGSGGNYVLLGSSPYHNAARDGTDIGANISALASVLAGNAAPANLPLVALTNMDDFGLGTPGWQSACVGPGCAGGVGTPSSWNQTFTNASPSLDGNSMMMTETGTNFSNVMFHDSIGADNSATTFTGSYRVYIPDLTPYQVFGMDMYQFIPGFRLMFGSQCAVAGSTAGFWSFFDQQPAPNGTWYVTTVPCPLTSAAWHAISMTVHRVPGDTSCPGGGPAVHYDSLTQDGTTYALNIAHCSETYGGANDTGMQFDVSSNAVGGTLTAYVDLMNYTATF